MKLCAYSGLVGVWKRARQWELEQLQSEQTLHRMLCQVISAEWAFLKLSVKALLMTETNKCMDCFALAQSVSIYTATECLIYFGWKYWRTEKASLILFERYFPS